MRDREQFDPRHFEDHYQRRYGNTGQRYEYFEPGYRYGFDAAQDDRYRGYSWNHVLTELRKDWGRRYPGRAFSEMSDAIYAGWQHARGQTPSQGNLGGMRGEKPDQPAISDTHGGGTSGLHGKPDVGDPGATGTPGVMDGDPV